MRILVGWVDKGNRSTFILMKIGRIHDILYEGHFFEESLESVKIVKSVKFLFAIKTHLKLVILDYKINATSKK